MRKAVACLGKMQLKLKNIINMRELLERYLMGNHITEMTWGNCLNSREDLVLLLRGWLQMTESDTIGDPNVGVGLKKLIKLQIGDKRYVLNADTRRKGVKVFLENEKNGNTWTYSETNRVSNASNREHIETLQMYRIVN